MTQEKPRKPKTMTTDMTLGLYRLIYGGFIKSKKFASVSLEAEAWFWRIHAIADDFGNADGDPLLCRDATAGRRPVTTSQVSQWLTELVSAGLVVRYESAGDVFIHIAGFETKQPGRANGTRTQKHPPMPDQEILKNPNQSKQSEPSYTNTYADTYSHTDTDLNPSDSSGEPQAASPAPPPTFEFPVFPTIGSVKSWTLEDPHLAELKATFEGINVAGEARKAHGWVKSNSGRRKTAKGMKKFIFDWMARSQNRIHPSGKDVPKVASPSSDWKRTPYAGG